MPNIDPTTLDLLRLTLTPGLGPVLVGRAIATCGSPEAVLRAPGAQLKHIKGIGPDKARLIHDGIAASEALAAEELALATSLGVTMIGIFEPGYPPLLKQIPDPPPVLYVRGWLRFADADRYPVGIVGSRSATAYGTEQAERFAAHLAQAGLTIVSGGARGIDTAAHRAAIRVKGRTIAVLGCGMTNCYPPENAPLFDQIIGSSDAGNGAIISELPLRTAPHADNFPARNRIISGLSLGVLVVEAGRRSGALITARIAAEDHGREVFALPSRVDSTAAEGSLDLIKKGGAAVVTHPGDILDALESPARHHHSGTHAAITADPAREEGALFNALDNHERPGSPGVPQTNRGDGVRDSGLSDSQRVVLAALSEPRSMDELARETGLEVATLRADVTVLEVRRRVRRMGSKVALAQ